MKKSKIRQSKFPPGWDEERVRRVLAHYEQQTEEEAVAEDEAAFEDRAQTTMEIPQELMPLVRELIAKYQETLTKDQVKLTIRGRPVRSWRPQPPSTGVAGSCGFFWYIEKLFPEALAEYQEKLKKGEMKD